MAAQQRASRGTPSIGRSVRGDEGAAPFPIYCPTDSKRLPVMLVAALVLLTACAPAWAAEAALQRLAVPSDAAQEEALKLVREVYKKEYATAKTAAEVLALARKMIDQAAKSTNDPAGCFVLLRTARDIAAKAGDAEVPLTAVEQMAGIFDVDALALKEEALRTASKAAATPDQLLVVAAQASAVAEDAVAVDNYEAATRLGELAYAAAQRSRDADAARRVAARNHQIAAFAQEFAAVKAAMATLEKTPTDAAASLRVGRHLCVLKGDWERGLPLLARGTDPELKGLAEKDLKGADAAVEQVALGDAWWTLADARDARESDAWRLRAGHWYEKALPGVTGLTKAKLEKRLKDVAAIQGPRAQFAPLDVLPGQEIPKGQWCDVLRWADPDKDGDARGWTRTAGALVTRHAGGGKWLALPVRIEGAYELLLEFVLPGKGMLNVVIPVGSHSVNVLSGPGFHGLMWVGGKGGGENPSTSKRNLLVLGRRHRMLISVRPEGDRALVTTSVDGKPTIEWQGAQTSLGGWEIPDKRRPYLGTWDADVVWHRALFRLVSGKATRVARNDAK